MSLFRCRRLLLVFVILLASCRQQQLSSADVTLDMSASDKRVGETTLLVRVSDRDGKAVSNPGTLSIRGDMDHAGMAPVLARAESAVDGVFSVPFEWTMGGSWTVEASLTLPNGDVARETTNFEILSEALREMDHSAMPGSAVYLRIHNRGQSDLTLVSASSSASRTLAFHRTVVEDDIARMEAVDSFFIPAGETLDLKPGGMHFMLTDLYADLQPPGALRLRLNFDSGEMVYVDVPVMNMMMSERDDAVELGGLVFSNRWARPALSGMDMQVTPVG